MRLFRVAAVLAALCLCGCATSIGYRADDVPDEPVSEGDHVMGRVLIYTTKTDDDRLITAGATSVTGTGLKLTTPVGVMVREIALRVFSKVATDGADASDNFVNAGRYTVVIRPQIENFEYGFQTPKLGIEITPEVRVILRINLLDATGSVMLEKDYDSGVVSGSRHMVSRKVVERTNKLAHRVIYDLMRHAAADVRDYQQTKKILDRQFEGARML